MAIHTQDKAIGDWGLGTEMIADYRLKIPDGDGIVKT